MSLRTNNTAGYVYVLHEQDSNRYKIGKGVNVPRRLKQLQTGNSRELTIYAALYFNNRSKAETLIHDLLSAYRYVKGGKEWFILDRQGKHLLDIIFKKEVPNELEKERLGRLHLL